MPDPAGPRLLVVEDEAVNRSLMRAVVAKATDVRLQNATIVDAPTLADARRALAAATFDVVLLDVRLPDGSGLDLARELNRRPTSARPKIAILSASVLASERAAAMAAGCDVFLAKPYRPAEVQAILASLLEQGDGSA